MSFSVEKLADIEAHLANNPSLTEGGLPGPVDASIYFALGSNSHHMQNSPTTTRTLTLTTGTSCSAPSLPLSSRHGLTSTPLPSLPQLPPLPQLPSQPMMISICSATMSPLLQWRSLSLRRRWRRRKSQLLNQLLCSTWRYTKLWLTSSSINSPRRSSPSKSKDLFGITPPSTLMWPTEWEVSRWDASSKTIRSSLTISLIRSLLGKTLSNQLTWPACKSSDSLYENILPTRQLNLTRTISKPSIPLLFCHFFYLQIVYISVMDRIKLRQVNNHEFPLKVGRPEGK